MKNIISRGMKTILDCTSLAFYNCPQGGAIHRYPNDVLGKFIFVQGLEGVYIRLV